MEVVLNIISQKPEYVAFVFVIVNAFWVVFTYLNKKQHENKIIEVKQSLDLDLERRKKVFEMKANQYENYFKLIDNIHNKHQTDYQEIFTPVLNEFMSSFLAASSRNDKDAETQATIQFSENISKITRDGFKELSIIELETNSLRLTASDEVAKLLDEIKQLYSQMFDLSGKMMSDLIEIALNNNQELAKKNQEKIIKVGETIKEKVANLRNQMRNDLKQI